MPANTPPPGTTQNVINTNNPVANPVVPVAPPPVNTQTTPGAGYVSQDAGVQAQIAAMQQQTIAKSSQAQTQTTPSSPGQAGGTLKIAAAPQVSAPPVTATNQPTQQTYQTYTPPTAEAQQTAQIQEVARLNNISMEEAAKRFQNATAMEQGKVAFPNMNVPGQTQQGVNGLVYDPASGTYKDPLTKNFYAGFDPKLGHIFTSDQQQAINTIFADPTTGTMTSEDMDIAKSALEGGINNAINNPLPDAGITFRSGTAAQGTGSSVGASPGSEWENTLPPELQQLLDTIKVQADALAGSDNEMDQLIRDQQDLLQKRQAATEADIHTRASQQIEDQKIANKRAEAMVKTRMAALGVTGSSQELQYLRDTISGGERALRDISDSERRAVTEAQLAFQDNNLLLTKERLELAQTRRKEYIELQEKQFNLKQDYQDKLLQRKATQQQLELNDIALKEQKQQSVDKRLETLANLGVDYDMLPDSLKMDMQEATQLNDAGLRSYFQNVQKNAQLKQAKSEAEVKKLWNESITSKIELAEKIPEGTEYSETLPDGTVFSVKGMKPVSADWKTSQVTLGNNQYGPPGQYILSQDKSGKVVDAQYVGDHYTAPYFDTDTQEWKVYNPYSNSVAPVFNGGDYGEGYFAQSGTQSYVGGAQEQGYGVKEGSNGGYVISVPKGSGVPAPVQNGIVLSIGSAGGVQSVMDAIKQVESGGNYSAKGGSGEFGAYQFMPSSWKSWAGQYLGDPNAPMTPQNQDAVAQAKIGDLMDQGYDARQIALIWNGGSPKVKKGVNSFGVAYDSGAYANKVLGALGSMGQQVVVQDVDTGAIYAMNGLEGVGLTVGQPVNSGTSLGNSLGNVRITPFTSSGMHVVPTQIPQSPDGAQPQGTVSEVEQFKADTGRPYNPKSRKDQEAFNTWKTDKRKQGIEDEKLILERQDKLSGTEETKLYNKAFDSYKVIEGAVANVEKDPSLGGVSDLAIITAYARSLDPNTGVRDQEFANMSSALGELKRLEVLPKKYFQGDRLTPEGRKAFATAAKSQFEGREKEYFNKVELEIGNALVNGYNPDRVVPKRVLDEYKATKRPPNNPPAGRIWVMDSSGNVGSIPENEFDMTLYLKL